MKNFLLIWLAACSVGYGSDSAKKDVPSLSPQNVLAEKAVSQENTAASNLEHFKAVADKTREAWELLCPANRKKPNAEASVAKLEEAKKIYKSKEKVPFSRDVITVLLYKAKGFPDEACRQTSDNPLELSTRAMAYEAYQTAWNLKKPKSSRETWVLAKLIPIQGGLPWVRYSSESHGFETKDIPLFPGAKVLPNGDFYPGMIRKGPDGKESPSDKKKKQWFRTHIYWMLRAAELLYRARLYDDSWRAYFEAIHGWETSLRPLQLECMRSDGALSMEMAEPWHQAAKAAYRAGKKELARDLLFKAAVFGDEACYKDVQKTAADWLSDDKASTTEAPLSEKQRRKRLLAVVTYYKNLNVHPRAWSLVNQHRKYFDDPDKLIKELQEDWTKRLDGYGRHGFLNPYIYGQKVFQVQGQGMQRRLTRIKNPVDITVPWGMEDKALQEVAEKVKSLYKQTVPPGTQ